MNPSKNRTALMVFSLSASQEAQRKQVFGKNKRKSSTKFFQLLIDGTSQIAENSGLDVVWFDEKKQKGTGFASRFTNAYQDLFDQGYDHVISIGNDCPNLEIRHIQKAVRQLRQNKLVLGPAHDGGVYLIGISKTTFNGNAFQELPWQKEHLYQSLESWGKQAKLQTFSFEYLGDLDTFHDIVNFSHENPTNVLSLFIWNVLYGFSQNFNKQDKTLVPQSYYAELPSRAPPVSSKY